MRPVLVYTPAQLECAWTMSGPSSRTLRRIAAMRGRLVRGSGTAEAHSDATGVSSPAHSRWCSASGNPWALSLTARPTPAPKHSVTCRILSGRTPLPAAVPVDS